MLRSRRRERECSRGQTRTRIKRKRKRGRTGIRRKKGEIWERITIGIRIGCMRMF